LKKLILTKEAVEKLERELDLLIGKRKEISEEIKKARGFGDLSENAEYHAAREAQSLNETEILKVKGMLESYELEDAGDYTHDQVRLGSQVEVLYIESGDQDDFTLVTKIEADPFDGKISNESPIGSAIVGRKAGDVVNIFTPGGSVTLKVLTVTN
jgi:transcription elongation factor GreA